MASAAECYHQLQTFGLLHQHPQPKGPFQGPQSIQKGAGDTCTGAARGLAGCIVAYANQAA